MKTSYRIALPVMALAATAGIIFSCNRNSKTVRPARTALTEAVYASGNVYPQTEYRVYSTADGVIEKIAVSEGDSVQTGSLLFRVQSDIQLARQHAAQSALSKSTENLSANSAPMNEAQQLLRAAELKVQFDSVNYFRLKNLFDKNAVAKVELDKAELAYDVSKKDFSAKSLALEKLKNQLWLDLQNASSNARITAFDADNQSIVSRLNGIVYQLLKKEGELVRKGEAVALLGSGSDILIQLSIDESDLAKVKTGQKVLIKTDAYGDKIFNARIARIYPMLNKSDQSVRVDATFTDVIPQFVYGLTVEANIIVSEKSDALTIPRQYLQQGDTVWIKSGRDEKPVRVKTGAQNFSRVEILDGLNEQSEIVLK